MLYNFDVRWLHVTVNLYSRKLADAILKQKAQCSSNIIENRKQSSKSRSKLRET